MSSEFDRQDFWSRARRVEAGVGRQAMEKVLTAYYFATDAKVPLKQRMPVIGALVYLGIPSDLIPDVLPGGFADDMSVLVAALGAVALYVTERHIQQARRTLTRLWRK